jgi:hypothetical protein
MTDRDAREKVRPSIFRTFRRKPLHQTTQYLVGMLGEAYYRFWPRFDSLISHQEALTEKNVYSGIPDNVIFID